MSGIADQLMPAVAKSSSLRELYFGENPWTEKDWKSILNVCQKPSNLNILDLGMHTYLTEDCVKVQKKLKIRLDVVCISFQFQLIRRGMRTNPELEIIYKGQIKEQPAEVVNFKNILVDRLKALAMKPKKKKLRKNMGWVIFN